MTEQGECPGVPGLAGGMSMDISVPKVGLYEPGYALSQGRQREGPSLTLT